MARYLKRERGISVSHNFVAALWREYDLQWLYHPVAAR